ncbi:MAG TPA: hypothetical protein VMZ69_06990 [Saprospiraceae bacterium]|nr:hypothetical protein [Saprospiraceae bacterium]
MKTLKSLPVKLNPNQIYHIYNRGNNKQVIFFEEDNYKYFLNKVRKYLAPYCEILAYSLMPNHFHFLIYANEKTNIPYRRTNRLPRQRKKPIVKMSLFSWGLKQLLSTYARGINKRFNRTGSLFQQNTKSKMTSSESFNQDYSLWCFIYIHNNPKVAGLIDSPDKYEYTSYGDYLENKTDSICNIPLGRELLSLDLNEMFHFKSIEVPADVVKKIFK